MTKLVSVGLLVGLLLVGVSSRVEASVFDPGIGFSNAPLILDGDILYHDANGLARLQRGSSGQCITANLITILWGPCGGSHGLLSSSHSDVTPGTVLRGDVIVGQGGSPTWQRLGLGAVGRYLRSDGTDLLYSLLLASDLSGIVGLSNGGTNQNTWTPSRCVQVDAGGTALESAAAACGAGSGYATVEEEGTPLTQRSTINFVGASITCADSGGKTVCTVSGGSGSANVVEVSMNLGSAMGLYYSTTVTGQAWVTSSSVIACSMFGTVADGQTPETIAVAGIVPTVSDRVVGTGFNLNVLNPNGATGTVRAHCTGA